MIHKTHEIAQKLIASALVLTQQLHHLLTKEAILLKTKNKEPRALNTVTTQKDDIITQLSTFSRQIEQILLSEQLDARDGMHKYFEHARKTGINTQESAANWQKITDNLQDCRVLNEKNGACLSILNKHNARIFNILKGNNQYFTTYTQKGIENK